MPRVARRKRKPSRTSLRTKADTLFSLHIRRDGVCVRCGKTEGLQCAHIVSRRYLSTRWDDDNAVCLCAGCHIYMTHRPLEWDVWVTKRIGADAYAAIKRRALKTTKPDYEAIVARIKKAA